MGAPAEQTTHSPLGPNLGQPGPQPDEGAADAGGTRKQRMRANFKISEFAADKFVDFLLIFVGLYAATALQRYQDTLKEKEEYLALLNDFKGELAANLAQEASIEKDLGKIDDAEPGKNLGPLAKTFTDFFHVLHDDEVVAHCLHLEFSPDQALRSKQTPEFLKDCHTRYQKLEAEHSAPDKEAFPFRPVALTPFYRYEVWQLYLANGVKIFRNKELAVKIGEVYNNARLIEKQVADIESTYNDQFMVQVGRSAAADAELAELVHEEEEVHGLTDTQAVNKILHDIKDERYQVKEAESVLELKVERMKRTVLVMRKEINDVTRAIEAEVAKVK